MMRWLAMVLLLIVAGCEGPVGPAGPQGPQGPQGIAGPEGPGTRIDITGQLDANGEADVGLPPEAGTPDDLPVVGVYVSDGPSGPWYAVSDGVTGWPWFAVVESLGQLYVAIREGTPGWYYTVVVVY